MTIKHYIALIAIGVTLIACNSDKPKSKQKPSGEVTTNTIYAGEKQPCIDYYDELWCKDPRALGAEANITITVRKDKHGKPIVIDKEIR